MLSPAELIRDRRVKRRWTQIKLATVLQTKQTLISNWECGRKKPSPLMAGLLAEYLGGDLRDYCPQPKNGGDL